MFLITWIEEDATKLLGSGRRVLCHREACITGRAVMIVHRDLEVSTLEIWIGRVEPKALAASPRNLQYTQEG